MIQRFEKPAQSEHLLLKVKVIFFTSLVLIPIGLYAFICWKLCIPAAIHW